MRRGARRRIRKGWEYGELVYEKGKALNMKEDECERRDDKLKSAKLAMGERKVLGCVVG